MPSAVGAQAGELLGGVVGDVAYLAIVVVFFLLAIAFARVAPRL
jgi:hypothetical protein